MSNKFYGLVGFVSTVDAGNGIFKEVPNARPYSGDVEKNSHRMETGEGLNDNVRVTNSINIMADTYAFQNFQDIRYVEWMGVAWEVSYVEVQRPRLTLNLGGVYNGET